MNFRIYYKNLSSHIASKWTILLIDMFLVVISMLLACMVQFGISSVLYKMSLYVWIVCFSLLSNFCFFHIFRTHVGVIRFSSFVDIYRAFVCLTFSYGLLGLGNFCWDVFGFGETLPSSIIFMAYILNFSFMVCFRILVKMVHEAMSFDSRHSVGVFIYGFQGTGVNIAKSLRVNRNNHFRLRGFISDEPSMIGKHAMGCRVYANDRFLLEHLKKKDVRTIIVSPSKLSELEVTEGMKYLLAHDIHVMTVPPLSDCLDDGIIKDIHIEDWLKREPVHVDLRCIASCVEGRRILITGAAGNIGRGIVRQLAALNPYQLILVDQAESPLYDVQLELSDHWKNLEVKVLVADVANVTRMESIFKQYMPQIVFHAASYKDLSLMEDFVSEAVQTNVLGTMNLVNLSLMHRVNRFVMVSTDMVFNPTNTVSFTKKIAEMFVQASQYNEKIEALTQFLIVRFGDVYPDALDSLVTVPEACQLILEIGRFGQAGRIYVFNDKGASEMEMTWRDKIKMCNEDIPDYKQINERVLSLIEKSYTENAVNLMADMKEILSDSMKKHSMSETLVKKSF